MNILILTTSFPSITPKNIGGKFVLFEALGYACNGAKVTVLTPGFSKKIIEEYQEENLNIFRFSYFFPFLQKIVTHGEPIYGKNNLFLKLISLPFFLFSFFLHTLSIARNIDIIHCQWTVTVLFALPAKWIFGCKIFVTPRGSDLRLLPKWLNKFIFNQVDGSIDCYGPQEWNNSIKRTFKSNYIKLPLITKFTNHKEIPLDLQNIFLTKPESFKILYLGRLDSVKNDVNSLPITLLLEVIKNLLNKKLKVTLVYIGDGNLFKTLEENIINNNLQNDVFLLGSKMEPEKYIPFFDIGIGGINLNAVSQEFAINKTPQLMPKYTAENLGQLWIDKENSLLFEPNSVVSLEKAITFVIENPLILKEISIKSHNFISNFVSDGKNGGKKYLKEFKKILNEY